LRQSLFQPDPLDAVFDTWALCFQMIDYFETGDGKAPLGEASAQAAATCRRMEDDFAKVAAAGSKTGDISKIRAIVRKWRPTTLSITPSPRGSPRSAGCSSAKWPTPFPSRDPSAN
jgi:hypothetical protein